MNPSVSASQGGAFDVANTTKNLGDAWALSSTTRFYLSLDAVRDAGDVLLAGRGDGYAVPQDNPFVDVAGARPEI